MKNFDDLKFEPHTVANGGKQAKIFFDNGYGASIVGGALGLYGDGENTFELAVLYGNKNAWNITYSSGVADDVMGYQTIDEINETLKLIQELK